MRNIILFLLGLILIAGMVILGYYTTSNSSFVVWFGLIIAVISPIAFELLLLPFKYKDKKVITDLSKIPQIEALLNEAKNNESKVKLLELRIKELDSLISYESRRKTLIAERDLYINQGKLALKQVENINKSIELLTLEKEEIPNELKPLLDIIENVESNDIHCKVGHRTITIRQKHLESIPIYGPFTFSLLRTCMGFTKKHKVNNK